MQDWFFVQSAILGHYYVCVDINGYDVYQVTLSYYLPDTNTVKSPTDKSILQSKASARRKYKQLMKKAEDDLYGWGNEGTWEFDKNTGLSSIQPYFLESINLGNDMMKIRLNEYYKESLTDWDYDDSLEQEKREQEIEEFIKHNGYYLDEEFFEDIFWGTQDDEAFKIINQWVLRQEEDPTFIDRIYEEGAKEFEEKIWNPIMATEKDAEILDDEWEPVPNDYIQISDSGYDYFMDYREFEKNYVKRKDEIIRKQIDRALELTKDLTKEY